VAQASAQRGRGRRARRGVGCRTTMEQGAGMTASFVPMPCPCSNASTFSDWLIGHSVPDRIPPTRFRSAASSFSGIASSHGLLLEKPAKTRLQGNSRSISAGRGNQPCKDGRKWSGCGTRCSPGSTSASPGWPRSAGWLRLAAPLSLLQIFTRHHLGRVAGRAVILTAVLAANRNMTA
jgi:hypothetical protein